MFSFGAMDSRTLSHLVFWEQKENKRPECMVLKMLTASHSFLLCNHRHVKQTMNMVSIQGSSFYWGIMWLMKVGFSLWLWFERPPDAGFLQGWWLGVQRSDWSPRMPVFYGPWNKLHHLDAGGSFESGPTCGPMCCDSEALCVYCVFPQRFPSYTAQVNCELSKHFSSPLHTGYILPDSFLNSAIPQVGLIFILPKWRWCWEKWPKLLTL